MDGFDIFDSNFMDNDVVYWNGMFKCFDKIVNDYLKWRTILKWHVHQVFRHDSPKASFHYSVDIDKDICGWYELWHVNKMGEVV